jgi:GDP-L-fucose synthase
MNIFLTGGSGFIGKNIIEALGPKYSIIAPSSKELNLVDEQAVQDFFSTNNIDIVIHSAVKPGHRNAKDPSNQLYANTRMYFNIIRNADKFQRLVFLGSGAVYDVRKPMVKVDENDFNIHVPGDEHGFSKYIIAKHMEHLDDAVALRIFGIFGKYEDYAIRFISNTICKVLFDLPITIRQNRRFDYLYIDDLMPVIEHFIHNKPVSPAYNVTPDSSVELTSIAELVRTRSGKEVPINISEQGMGMEYSGNNARICTALPGLAFTPLAAAIDHLYSWYEDRKDLIDKNALLIDK